MNIYTLKEDFYYKCPFYVADFQSDWLIIKDQIIKIPKNYSWNGCSPKFYLFKKIVGTPDFSTKTYYASLVHDALYQFSSQHFLTRNQSDLIFYFLCKKENFFLSKLYYSQIRLWGWLAWK